MTASSYKLSDIPDLTAAHHAAASTRTIGEFALEYECRTLSTELERAQTSDHVKEIVQRHLDKMIFALVTKGSKTEIESQIQDRLTDLRLQIESKIGTIDCHYLPKRQPIHIQPK